MELTWNYAEKLLAKLDSPWGDSGSWNIWFEEAWGYLSKAGLTTINTPVDYVLVRLRLMALRWLTLDYGSAVERDHWNDRPNWKSWSEAIAMPPALAVWTVASDRLAFTAVADSDALKCEFVGVEDGEIYIDEEDVAEDVCLRLMGLAVFRQRDAVVHAIESGFGDLLGSLYANYTSSDTMFDLIRDRTEELQEKLEFLEAKVASGEGDPRLQLAINETHSELETKNLQKYAMKYLRKQAHSEPGTGREWWSSGCPVISFGTPSVSVYVD